MRVHLYTQFWNERHMVDSFLRHYEGWVDQFFLYDDKSNDGTAERLSARPDVTVRRFEHADPDSFVRSVQHFNETAWQADRDACDWVLIANMDEHVYHPDMAAYLERAHRDGVTVIPALGFQMVADTYPVGTLPLSEVCTRGAPWRQMSKAVLFRPGRIREMNYSPGRHTAQPSGDVVYPRTDEVLLLHYKYMGLDYIAARHFSLNGKLKSGDKAWRFGHRYSMNGQELRSDFDAFLARSVEVHDWPHHHLHPEPRWWRRPDPVRRRQQLFRLLPLITAARSVAGASRRSARDEPSS